MLSTINSLFDATISRDFIFLENNMGFDLGGFSVSSLEQASITRSDTGDTGITEFLLPNQISSDATFILRLFDVGDNTNEIDIINQGVPGLRNNQVLVSGYIGDGQATPSDIDISATRIAEIATNFEGGTRPSLNLGNVIPYDLNVTTFVTNAINSGENIVGFRFTPGGIFFDINIADSLRESFAESELIVSSLNNPPEINGAGIPELQKIQSEEFNENISSNFSDPDLGDILTFTATGLPNGLSISPAGVITGTAGEIGTSNVTVTATDRAGESIFDTFRLTILPNTNPLKIETVGGEFEDNNGDKVFTFSGTINIGRQDGINKLIRVEGGNAELDEEKLTISGGTIFSEINNISEPLFKADLTLPFATATALIPEITILNDLELGGLDTNFTEIKLLPEGISLEGNLLLPESRIFAGLTVARDRQVNFTAQDALFIGERGIGFGSEVGKVAFPTTKLFNLSDLLGLTNRNAEIAYIREENGQIENKLKIQGKFEIRDLKNLVELDPAKLLEINNSNTTGLELNLSDDRIAGRENFIQIKNGITDVRGEAKLKDLPLPSGFELKELSLRFNTENQELVDIAGTAEVQLPLQTKRAISGTAGFKSVNNSFALNEVRLQIDNLDLPVIKTPIFLQRVAGGVNNLAPDEIDTSYLGGLGVTFLQQITFNPPKILSGLISPVTASIVRLDGDFESNGTFYEGQGRVQFLNEDLFDARGRITWDLDKKVVDGSLNIKAFGNTQPLIEGNGDLTINYDSNAGSVSLGGSGSLKFPNSLLLGLVGLSGKEIGGASLQVNVSLDNNSSNDYIAAWGNITLPIFGEQTAGIQLFLNGDFNPIGPKNIPPRNSFDVEPGTEWILLSAAWENPTANNVAVRVINETGAILEEADFDANNIFVVDDLTSPNTKTVLVANPNPGVWDLEVVAPSGLGNVQISAARDSAAPTLAINNLTPNGSTVAIDYEALDLDSDALIQLYYDNDDLGFDGVLIAQAIAENDGIATFNWNTAGVAPDNYFIYGVIQDENNAPVFSNYSSIQVEITEATDLSVTQSADRDLVNLGDRITYTINVSNDGLILDPNVQLSYDLASEFNFVSSSINPSQQENNILTFDLGELAPGSSTILEVVAEATTPTTREFLSSAAIVNGTIFDSNITNDVDIINVDKDLSLFVPPPLNLVNITEVDRDSQQLLAGLSYQAGTDSTQSIATKLADDLLNLGVEAVFDNLVGFYEIVDPNGGIDTNNDGIVDLTPDQDGYAQFAIANRINAWELRSGSMSDSTLNTTAAQFGDVIIAGDRFYAPFAIANGGAQGFDDFITSELAETTPFNNAAEFIADRVAYFAYLGANPDGVRHIQARGNGVYGFEDLPSNLGVSDNDFDDAVFKFDFTLV